MAANEIRVGDIGTTIQATIKDGGDIVDISGITLTWIFKKPNGTVVTKAGSLVTDGSDGNVKYVVESGFFDVPGVWKYQVGVDYGGDIWKTDIGEFYVYKNLS